MAKALTCFSAERDGGIIQWDGHPNDFPLDPINHLLMTLYNNDMRPFLFMVYEDGRSKGMLVFANFNPQTEGEVTFDQLIAAKFNEVLFSHKYAPQEGEWEPRDWEI